MIQLGRKIVFGVCELKPLRGFPEGKKRIRMRTNKVVKVFVRSGGVTSQFAVEQCDGYWQPACKLGQNATVQ